ncbi:hypothetical protein SDJN02_07893, partial [Cucurbita argyrosperma subsp. argyrosperma]
MIRSCSLLLAAAQILGSWEVKKFLSSAPFVVEGLRSDTPRRVESDPLFLLLSPFMHLRQLCSIFIPF